MDFALHKKDAKVAHKAYLTVAAYVMADKEFDADYYAANDKFDQLCLKWGWSMAQFGIRTHP